MGSRLKLHEELCEVLGSRNVYFHAPESLKMQYDAIRYSLSDKDLKRANDGVYLSTNQYEGIVITYDPDSDLPDRLIKHFQMFNFGKPYVADNLCHFPFTLYY